MKKITIVTPTFNEEDNVSELYRRIKEVISKLQNYNFDILFIDNASTDSTTRKIKDICKKDKNVKLIINNRNFGHIRSPYWGILRSKGDATIYLASDLQDPPELIPNFIFEWEAGNEVVLAVKPKSKENKILFGLRRLYYKILNSMSEYPLTKNTTGFGLYDKKVIDKLNQISDPYPYLRGLIDELGYRKTTIEFEQPKRGKGITKNNFYSLVDIGLLGMVSHTKIPIRIATFFGMSLGLLSILLAITVVVIKLISWNVFAAGTATLLTFILFMFGCVFLIMGLLGEYILSIHNYVKNRPIVIERERVNFDED